MDMVEKVARELIKGMGYPEPYEKMTPKIRELWQWRARAAIEAMRESTEAMTDHPSYVNGEWSRRNINAYFDAALAPAQRDEVST